MVREIPLTAAVAALERDLRGALPGGPDEVRVDLGLVARDDGGGVRWVLASAGEVTVHRVRFVIRPDDTAHRAATHAFTGAEEVDTADAEAWDGGGMTELPVGEDLDPADVYVDLPPIVRPKPGIDGERRDG